MRFKFPLATTTWEKEEFDAMQRIIRSGMFTMGDNVLAFEQAFSQYIGSQYCVMVNSGSSANLLMIASLFYTKNSTLKLHRGDEVIVPAVSWSTTYYPLFQYGLKIKLVDIDLHTLNIDLTQLEDAITDKTRLIMAVNLLGNANDFSKIRILGLQKKTRFYQASTSEMYGLVQQTPQNELTPFYPRSPYAVAKLYAYWITVNYREAYGVYACNGILFNHESPIRGETFVTRKITRALARIKLGQERCLYLGNLNARRDWGHAKDFVEMQWLMLQQNLPEDFVIATGIQHSVREFVEMAARELEMSISWNGEGSEEKGYDMSGRCIIAVDPRYFRPTEVDTLLGDATKAQVKLGWAPKVSFEELVREMVKEDLRSAERDVLIKKNGYPILNNHE